MPTGCEIIATPAAQNAAMLERRPLTPHIQPMLKSAPSRTLLVLTIAVAVITLWLPYAGSFAAAFGFVPLPAHLFATVIVIVIGYILITEAVKARYYRPPVRS